MVAGSIACLGGLHESSVDPLAGRGRGRRSGASADHRGAGRGIRVRRAPRRAPPGRLGSGEVGQTYISFALADGNFWVGSQGEARLIEYIERNWSNPTGASLVEAQLEASSLLPADAKLVEHYTANYAQILHGTVIGRYRSGTLGELFKERGDAARSFVVLYELAPAEAAFDSIVSRYVIVVGAEPTS